MAAVTTLSAVTSMYGGDGSDLLGDLRAQPSPDSPVDGLWPRLVALQAPSQPPPSTPHGSWVAPCTVGGKQEASTCGNAR